MGSNPITARARSLSLKSGSSYIEVDDHPTLGERKGRWKFDLSSTESVSASYSKHVAKYETISFLQTSVYDKNISYFRTLSL